MHNVQLASTQFNRPLLSRISIIAVAYISWHLRVNELITSLITFQIDNHVTRSKHMQTALPPGEARNFTVASLRRYG